jgi:hypothetical protein
MKNVIVIGASGSLAKYVIDEIKKQPDTLTTQHCIKMKNLESVNPKKVYTLYG